MVLAAPEFVESQVVEVGDQFNVSPDLQGRVFADRVARGQENGACS